MDTDQPPDFVAEDTLVTENHTVAESSQQSINENEAGEEIEEIGSEDEDDEDDDAEISLDEEEIDEEEDAEGDEDEKMADVEGADEDITMGSIENNPQLHQAVAQAS